MFKIVAVIGPRQSGKTTLVKSTIPKKAYINLENPDNRRFAIDDPRGFLDQFPNGAIIDEAQRCPELFSYLQEFVDNKNEPGQFVLTGSNNFLLNEKISQTLAGRVGFLNLLPFCLKEVSVYNLSYTASDYILNGFFPPVYDQKIGITEWAPAYIRTYIERDVRQIKNILDLLVFERFLKLLAGRVGNELNYSSLSVEIGVDVKTIQSWIGILESSFIIFLLKPFYKNFNKTIVKRPKIYFYDNGIVASLLGINKKMHVDTHPLKGALFENMIVSEIYKQCSNTGNNLSIYFWRDKTGREIDLILEQNINMVPIEIKSGKTINEEFFKNIRYWKKLTGTDKGIIVYGGEQDQKRSNGLEIISWLNIDKIFRI